MGSTAPAPLAAGGIPAPPALRAADIALFADLDGTLAPIEATPDRIGPNAERRRLLDALTAALGGRLAVISGRGLDDLDRVLERRIPALAAVHGLVRRRGDGHVVTAPGDAAVGPAEAALRAFAGPDERLLVEGKGPAVSLHFRRAPEREGGCRDFARRLAADLGLALQDGDMVAELRAAGPDKGDAIAAFMREAPFAGHTPVFLGDDLTDEAGFRVVQALGGVAIVVGPRRPTLARYALADAAAARAWLGRIVDA